MTSREYREGEGHHGEDHKPSPSAAKREAPKAMEMINESKPIGLSEGIPGGPGRGLGPRWSPLAVKFLLHPGKGELWHFDLQHLNSRY